MQMKSSRISVRRVDPWLPENRKLIMHLQKKILPNDEPRELLGDHWWIAYIGTRPAGFASVRFMDGGFAYLSRSGVLPFARGKGLQKRMIRARVRYARRCGMKMAITDTTDNPPSSNSLISCGFKLYNPQVRWALPRALYWYKKL